MQPMELLDKLSADMGVRRVFGEPYERENITIIPVASLRGGAGFGRGTKESGTKEEGAEDKEEPRGGGLGIAAKPVGAFIIKGDKVSWVPAFNLNRVILGGQLLGGLVVVAVLVRWLTRRPAKRWGR